MAIITQPTSTTQTDTQSKHKCTHLTATHYKNTAQQQHQQSKQQLR